MARKSARLLLAPGNLSGGFDVDFGAYEGKPIELDVVHFSCDVAHGRTDDISDMQRVPPRLHRGLREDLAQRRVGVDRAGDVLQRRAHLDREAEGGR